MGCLEPPAERRPKAPWRCKHCLAHHTTKPARKLDAAETVKKKYSKVWEKNRDVRTSKYVYDDILFHVTVMQCRMSVLFGTCIVKLFTVV